MIRLRGYGASKSSNKCDKGLHAIAPQIRLRSRVFQEVTRRQGGDCLDAMQQPIDANAVTKNNSIMIEQSGAVALS
jgi:hypothetical protein